jgi:hypothetical protein
VLAACYIQWRLSAVGLPLLMTLSAQMHANTGFEDVRLVDIVGVVITANCDNMHERRIIRTISGNVS